MTGSFCWRLRLRLRWRAEQSSDGEMMKTMMVMMMMMKQTCPPVKMLIFVLLYALEKERPSREHELGSRRRGLSDICRLVSLLRCDV